MSVQTGGRQILMHGMILILVGLLWGVVVPGTPYPRLALGAHIQFEENGLLLVVLALLLLTLRHNVGTRSIWVMVLSAWLIWPMVLSEAANAWWGTTQALPIAAREAGASGGEPWQELIVTLAHIGGGLSLIVAWTLLVIGFARRSDAMAAALVFSTGLMRFVKREPGFRQFYDLAVALPLGAIERLLYQYDRLVEVARLGVSGGQGIDGGPLLVFLRFAQLLSPPHRLFAVAQGGVRAGRQYPSQIVGPGKILGRGRQFRP